MDILKAEIAKKRKQLEQTELVNENKKYFKRGDLAAIEKEEYLSKYAQANKETSNASLTESKDVAESDSSSELQTLPRNEVIQRLRERCEPILLFGETEVEAFRRLRRCEILEPEVNRGFRNDFQEAMDQVDQAYLDELLASGQMQDSNSNTEFRDSSSDLSYEGIKELSKSMGRGNRDLDMKVVMTFLQFLLKMWGEQLHTRSAAVKMGTRGKMAGATFTQTQVYLKPLLRKLKNHSLPEDISDSLTEIVRHLLNRNYLMASDAYLQMAIGNAPWPIGVTMVGIHARTGREKIFSKNVAHVMNDETQRKYIQALKRLMTKCQEYFPTDPSRCVEYQAFGSPSQPSNTN